MTIAHDLAIVVNMTNALTVKSTIAQRTRASRASLHFSREAAAEASLARLNEAVLLRQLESLSPTNPIQQQRVKRIKQAHVRAAVNFILFAVAASAS